MRSFGLSNALLCPATWLTVLQVCLLSTRTLRNTSTLIYVDSYGIQMSRNHFYPRNPLFSRSLLLHHSLQASLRSSAINTPLSLTNAENLNQQVPSPERHLKWIKSTDILRGQLEVALIYLGKNGLARWLPVRYIDTPKICPSALLQLLIPCVNFMASCRSRMADPRRTRP